MAIRTETISPGLIMNANQYFMSDNLLIASTFIALRDGPLTVKS